jgi:hypothetical protein
VVLVDAGIPYVPNVNRLSKHFHHHHESPDGEPEDPAVPNVNRLGKHLHLCWVRREIASLHVPNVNRLGKHLHTITARGRLAPSQTSTAWASIYTGSRPVSRVPNVNRLGKHLHW